MNCGVQKNNIQLLDYCLGGIFLLMTYFLGFQVEQGAFYAIISFYSIFFVAYVWVLQGRSDVPWQFYIGIALFIRLVLVFAMPNLSNDVFRFIWDGRLLVQGYNPFDHLPMYYLENETGVKGLSQALFEAYDAKNFYTVYPPVAQAQFGTACYFFPDDMYWSSVIMKLWLFLFEAGSIFLIVKLLYLFKWPVANVLIYALNPLVIFEITGNLHFEGAMIFFLLLAMWLLVKNKWHWSAIAFGLSVCSKLLTLMFLPFFIKQLPWKKVLMYYLLTGLSILLLFVPILNEAFITNFGQSLNLYFQKLEFNASFYYLLRWIGFKLYGYNLIAIIGPALGLIAGGSILYMAFVKQKQDQERTVKKWLPLFKWFMFAFSVYLLSATTIHPWYVAMLIALCVFTNYRYPVLWSYLITWTYINYSYPVYEENLWVVGMEYGLLFLWFFNEYRRNAEKKPNLVT